MSTKPTARHASNWTATALLIVATALSATPGARAEIATEAEMEVVCQNWLAHLVYETGAWAGDIEPGIMDVQELVAGDMVLAHCFSISPDGFVVVPVLKELPPVKAYSEQYALDVDAPGGIAQLLRDVLEDRINRFVERYGSLDATQPPTGNVLFDRVNRAAWDQYTLDPAEFLAELESGRDDPMRDAGPLLTTNWHQRAPYNALCPAGDTGCGTCPNGNPPSAPTVVGCVATAAAQVMNFWHWPINGTGDMLWPWPGDTSCGNPGVPEPLYADFSDVYDWANMPDDCAGGCAPAQEDALAELCYEVGVAYAMDYGVCGSGTQTWFAVVVLPGFFKYEPGINRQNRSDYDSPDDWFNMIVAEIDAGRPMTYRIVGHSIVCDGWRILGGQNQYHMNYGWGGPPSTTWYNIDNLYCPWEGCDPEEEYLIRNIYPLNNQPPVCEAAGPYAVECQGPYTLVQLDGTASYDPEGGPLSYTWTTDCPTTLGFDDPTSPTPILTVDTYQPCPLICNVYLEVSDNIDSAGDSASVIINDTQAPIISNLVATGGDVDANCEYVLPFSAVVDDTCGIHADGVSASVTLLTGNATLDPPDINIQENGLTQVLVDGTVLVHSLTGCPATIQVTVDALDGCDNLATSSVTADVWDRIDPELTCPPDAFFEHGSFFCNEGEVLEWLNSATATDNCDTDVDIVHDAPACGFPPDSTTLVTWTATDDCGNTDECSATVTIPPLDRGQPVIKGSLLVYPNVEVRWDAGGNLIQDTFLSVSNDFPEDVWVLAYLVSETCTNRNNDFVLTHNEPAYWSAATGLPKGLSPWAAVAAPYADPEGSGEFIARGFVIVWAINPDHEEIRWNHLHGQATIVNYADSSAWEYLAWAFPTDCVEHGEQPLDCLEFDADGACCTADVIPGNLDFDGFQYDITPERLLLSFIASGSEAFSMTGHTVTHDTDLTLLLMDQDLRQETLGPYITKASFDIWNENEVSFSGMDYCVVKWDQSLLSRLGSHFLRENLQTDAGRARIDGLASALCPESMDAALIGVANRVLEMGGTRAQSGSSLWLIGREAAHLQVDIPAPPEEKNMPTPQAGGAPFGPSEQAEVAQEPR